jgi:hypothetical protein
MGAGAVRVVAVLHHHTLPFFSLPGRDRFMLRGVDNSLRGVIFFISSCIEENYEKRGF